MPTRDLETLSKGIWNKLARIENMVEQEMLGNYRAALEDIYKELGRVFRKYAKDGVLTKTEMTRYNRMFAMQKRITKVLGPTLSKNGQLVERLAEVEYGESFFRHAWALDQHAGAALRWGQLPEDAIRAAVQNPLRELAKTGLRQEGLVGIRRTIVQGLIKGSSYRQMAQDMRGFLERSASGYVRVARTEGNRAAVQGQLDNYDRAEELGVEMGRYWVATLDRATRPHHAELDGQRADADGLFHTAVGKIPGPGMSGVAAFDINCRCRVRGQIDEFPPQVRRIRDEGLQPYQTYREWAAERGITRNKYGRRVA